MSALHSQVMTRVCGGDATSCQFALDTRQYYYYPTNIISVSDVLCCFIIAVVLLLF